jgi:hypothetical protein
MYGIEVPNYVRHRAWRLKHFYSRDDYVDDWAHWQLKKRELNL